MSEFTMSYKVCETWILCQLRYNYRVEYLLIFQSYRNILSCVMDVPKDVRRGDPSHHRVWTYNYVVER